MYDLRIRLARRFNFDKQAAYGRVLFCDKTAEIGMFPEMTYATPAGRQAVSGLREGEALTQAKKEVTKRLRERYAGSGPRMAGPTAGFRKMEVTADKIKKGISPGLAYVDGKLVSRWSPKAVPKEVPKEVLKKGGKLAKLLSSRGGKWGMAAAAGLGLAGIGYGAYKATRPEPKPWYRTREGMAGIGALTGAGLGYAAGGGTGAVLGGTAGGAGGYYGSDTINKFLDNMASSRGYYPYLDKQAFFHKNNRVEGILRMLYTR